jgi:hypothetical protein
VHARDGGDSVVGDIVVMNCHWCMVDNAAAFKFSND